MPLNPVVDPIQERLNQLEAELGAVRENQGRARSEDSDEELEPFSPHILNTLFPSGFKIHNVSTYDGTTDRGSHLSTFNTVMRASNVGLKLRCMLFPTTLTGQTKSWFDKFRRHSIVSWDQLSSEFKKQFRAARTIKPEASSLANIKQKIDETLKKYLAMFNIEAD